GGLCVGSGFLIGLISLNAAEPSPYRWYSSTQGDTHEHGPMCSRIHAFRVAWIATSDWQTIPHYAEIRQQYCPICGIFDRIYFMTQDSCTKKSTRRRKKITRSMALQQVSVASSLHEGCCRQSYKLRS